jgi:hypothetical protein
VRIKGLSTLTGDIDDLGETERPAPSKDSAG